MIKKNPKQNVRILTVSDFIDKDLTRMVEEKSLGPVDLVISCGDMEPEYLSFLKDRLDTPLFYVKGNHDIRYTGTNPMGCENIHAKVVSFKGLNILGLEGSMWYNGGANQYTEAMMKRIIFGMWFSIWRKGRIHMVVAHASPRHIHDREDRCHIGFESFVTLIRKRRPHYFIHGHVHQAFESLEQRTTRVGGTRVINTCGFTLLEV
ncbi:metallophosphoesterase family protein [Desulfospira joergensenii]|uniref:metallophosphoesterase family protein n=1 Tax=Desulfospira joergensenii TaxID=53329 RepID=UPI0003B33466|nr:metallophosphoesterase [Desulfospira joergensenii]